MRVDGNGNYRVIKRGLSAHALQTCASPAKYSQVRPARFTAPHWDLAWLGALFKTFGAGAMLIGINGAPSNEPEIQGSYRGDHDVVVSFALPVEVRTFPKVYEDAVQSLTAKGLTELQKLRGEKF